MFVFMRNVLISLVFAMAIFSANCFAEDAMWIIPDDNSANARGAWGAFRGDVEIDSVPSSMKAKIAADSKYWLWINGKLAVYDGGLKRGPTPNGGYYDEIEIAPFLKRGENKIAALVWFFGKDGFSHQSSGKMGFFLEGKGEDAEITTSNKWFAAVHPAFSAAENPPPNFRLPESNVRFDANKNTIEGWQTADSAKLKKFGFKTAITSAYMGWTPWGEYQKRNIPMWKDFGVKKAKFVRKPLDAARDVVEAALPYNMHVNIIFEVYDPVGGNLVDILTDHTHSASQINLRGEYITKKGSQKYELFSWLNGEKIILQLPKDVVVKSLEYRQTGYNTEFEGSFSCESDYYNLFWKKALDTLYVNMRGTYYDCPDRERAQWIGDLTFLAAESFYTQSVSSHALARKGLREFAAWRKPDGALYAPVPCGKYFKELPAQSLAAIGEYGLWNYYMNTGDADTLAFVYPAMKGYLARLTQDDDGFTNEYYGSWTWGDWGVNKDIRMIYAAWHYIALESAAKAADALGKSADAAEFRQKAARLKAGFNKYWNGKAYRFPTHKGENDDRVQALAVVSGLADESKYPQIFDQFMKHSNASPYMEKYVMEALVKMGHADIALSRYQLRFYSMVVSKKTSTLWEGWEIGGFGGGSTNHGWSGGGLVVIAHDICGLYPLEPAWKTFAVAPEPSVLGATSITVPTVAGKVKSAFSVADGEFRLEVSVPENTTAIVYLPKSARGGISVNGSEDLAKFKTPAKFESAAKRSFALPEGDWKIVVGREK